MAFIHPTVFSETFTVLVSILIILIGYPILIIFFFPCWIYKRLVMYIVQKNPKYGRILEGIDGTSAGKTPHSNPDVVVIPSFYLDGNLEVSNVVKVVKEKIIEPGWYPELQQKIVQKYGYHFWYTVENFKVEDHVRNLNPENPKMPVTDKELRKIANQKLARLPFDSERSPWELIVVENFVDEKSPKLKSALLLRTNHCMMDGFSVVNFIMKASSKPLKSPAQQTEKLCLKTKLIHLYNFVMLLIVGPYHYLKMFVLYHDRNEFVRNVFKPDYQDVWKTQGTPTVPKNRLNLLRDFYGVSMSALVTTIFGLTYYKTMKQAQAKNLNKTIHAFLSYPMPGHKDILTNHWNLVRIPIQVNEEDPAKTLEFVEKEYQSLQNSVKSLLFFYVSNIMALAPLGLRLGLGYLPPTTFVLTNFRFPQEPTYIFGRQWKKFNLSGKGAGGSAFMSGCFSVCGDFWLDAVSPLCNLPVPDDDNSLSNSMMETLSDLESRIPEKKRN